MSCDRCGRTQRECGKTNRVQKPRLDVVNKHGDFFLSNGDVANPQAYFCDTVTGTAPRGHLCAECVSVYRNGKLCATCHKTWSPEDASDQKMIKCDGSSCRLWAHAACDGLDDEAYEQVGDGTHPAFGLEFLCAAGCA
ncbi:MAG: hypothetical protein AAGN82_06425, partial [Myxococcota bacterium]